MSSQHSSRPLLTSLALVVGVFAGFLPGVGKSEEPAKTCPPSQGFSEDAKSILTASPARYPHANVVVGVDVLGRIVAALDTNRDRVVDEYLLFTDEVRLEGPWSARLQDATVMVTKGTARIEARDRSVGVALAVKGLSTPELSKGKAFSRALVRASGVEFVRMPAASDTVTPMDALDVNSVHTWPEAFHGDLLKPQTSHPNCNCVEYGCDAGGCGAVHCDRAAVSPWPGCATTCGTGYFACLDPTRFSGRVIVTA